MAKRPLDYAERRTDGYTEPLELYVLGTSHVSETSAADVRQVLDIVRPQSVVVEVGTSAYNGRALGSSLAERKFQIFRFLSCKKTARMYCNI